METLENIVEKTIDSNIIYQKIKKQVGKGIKKYGTPVNPEHYSVLGWQEHLDEELVDALTYSQIQLYKTEQAIVLLKKARSAIHGNQKDEYIHKALAVMTGGRNHA